MRIRQEQNTTIAMMLLAFLACSKGGDSRQQSVGQSLNSSDIPVSTSSSNSSSGSTATGGTNSAGGGTSTAGGTGTGTNIQVGTSTGQGTAIQANAKSLEQCQALKQAWRAVVNGGNSPSDCVETLVPWCCTQAEIDARFPTMKPQIDSNLAQFVTTEGNVLYACSTDGAGKYTMHMAKIVNGTTTYRTMFVAGVAPVETNNPANNCPSVTTQSLQKLALDLDEPQQITVDLINDVQKVGGP